MEPQSTKSLFIAEKYGADGKLKVVATGRSLKGVRQFRNTGAISVQIENAQGEKRTIPLNMATRPLSPDVKPPR